jgi:uncharacterized protein YecT (DUF1311 family)
MQSALTMSRSPRIRSCAFIAFALAAIPALAAGPYPNTEFFGVPFSADEAWYRQCMRVEKLPPEPATGKAAAGCDAAALYYIKRNQAQTSPAEWEQVRQCAIGTDNKAVLMMLYANGYGVARDTDRAIHYACSLGFVAKSEMEHRVAHLAGDPAEVRNHGKLFDLCDDITSGAMGGVCAELRETQDRRVREARLARMAGALPPAGRDAFARLRAAAERYAEAGAREVDAHGTAAAEFATRRQARLREEFMQAALDAFNGKLPAASPEQFAERDRELNTRYQSLMAAPSKDPDEPGRIGESTMTHKDVREVERLWLAYRDAFAAFGAALGSAADPAAIKAALTSQRIAILEDIAKYI